MSDGKIIQLSSFEKYKFMVSKEKSAIQAILAVVLGSLKLTVPDLLPGLNPEGSYECECPMCSWQPQQPVRMARFQYKFQCDSVLSPHHQAISDTSLVSHTPDTLYSEKTSDSTGSGLPVTRQPLPHLRCTHSSRLSAVPLVEPLECRGSNDPSWVQLTCLWNSEKSFIDQIIIL